MFLKSNVNMSMSTPINQIRSMSANPSSGGVLPPELIPQVQSSQPGQQLIAPVYNPNVDLSSASVSNSQLVDDILKEMDTRPIPGANHMMDTNVGNINYAMDPVAHVPPEHNPNAQRLLTNGEQTQMPSIVRTGNIVTNRTQYLDDGSPWHDEGKFYNKLLIELKPVVIVFVIVLLLSLHQTNRLIFGFLPNLILENGELSIYAILLRAGIASALFFIMNKFMFTFK